ncbi:ABC transporter permease [Kurthia sibirica]|uniref:ABC transporter permease n=1 Tax=Kurthia sibirica TaxID=202750 RepID=A0A2U3ALE8_9BACL|nr:ABC-2 family transporter protein [Kurthia sibirica]PWI25356.1 ABC transporter permease [Kurthia sibirica]GEK35465.1 ABC transporter permease [Kurthia sibirica]
MIIKTIDKYSMVMGVSIKNTLVYSKEILYRTSFMILLLFIFIQLWTSAYGDEASIAGYTLSQTIWYLVVTETILLSKIAMGNQISGEVISGSLAYTLGKPYHYMVYNFFSGLGDSFIRLFINFIVGSVLVFIIIGPISFKVSTIVPIMLVVLLALILDYLIIGMIALMAFFMEDVSSLFFIYSKMLFILGGLLIPIDFFPGWLQNIATTLPFNLILFAPASLFVNFSISAFLNILYQQLFWILIFSLILETIYRIGQKKLTSNGG